MKKTYKILASLLLVAVLAACKGNTNPSDGEVKETNPKIEEEAKDDVNTKEDKEENAQEDSKAEENSQADLDADQILDDMLEASLSLKKLHSKNNFMVDDGASVENQLMEGEGEFNPKTGEVLNGKYNITNSDGSYQKIEFVGDEEGTGYMETGHADGSMTKENYTGGGYFITPNYFELVRIINSMKGDLDVTEEGDSYKLSLKSQNTDLFGLFKEQFSIKFTNFDQHETEKNFEILVDKESKLLKDLKLSFKIDDETKGYIYLEVLSNFDKFEIK